MMSGYDGFCYGYGSYDMAFPYGYDRIDNGNGNGYFEEKEKRRTGLVMEYIMR